MTLVFVKHIVITYVCVSVERINDKGLSDSLETTTENAPVFSDPAMPACVAPCAPAFKAQIRNGNHWPTVRPLCPKLLHEIAADLSVRVYLRVRPSVTVMFHMIDRYTGSARSGCWRTEERRESVLSLGRLELELVSVGLVAAEADGDSSGTSMSSTSWSILARLATATSRKDFGNSYGPLVLGASPRTQFMMNLLCSAVTLSAVKVLMEEMAFRMLPIIWYSFESNCRFSLMIRTVFMPRIA